MYTPNYNNKKTYNLFIKAITFVEKYVSPHRANWLSTRYIDEHFGQGQLESSKFLRHKLLICVDPIFTTGKCKQYILNERGLNELKTALGICQRSNRFDQYRDQIESGLFEYQEKSSRHFHPLQNIPKSQRDQWREMGYIYNYDIQCCAHTLIYQYAQQLGLDEYLFALTKYINNRQQVRQELAEECEVSPEVIKEILQALLNGAVIKNDKQSSIYRALQGDLAKIKFLQQHTYIQELKSDIKKCWSYIKDTLPQRYITTQSGITKRLPLNSKQKASVYRDRERQVMREIERYLTLTGNRYFTEHDGWRCVNEVDIDEVIDYVKTNTGYMIKIDID